LYPSLKTLKKKKNCKFQSLVPQLLYGLEKQEAVEQQLINNISCAHTLLITKYPYK